MQKECKNLSKIVASHGAAAIIIDRVDTSGTLGRGVEPGNEALLYVPKVGILPFVKNVCLVKLPIPVLAFSKARRALREASLRSWTTFPEAAAVWRN